MSFLFTWISPRIAAPYFSAWASSCRTTSRLFSSSLNAWHKSTTPSRKTKSAAFSSIACRVAARASAGPPKPRKVTILRRSGWVSSPAIDSTARAFLRKVFLSCSVSIHKTAKSWRLAVMPINWPFSAATISARPAALFPAFLVPCRVWRLARAIRPYSPPRVNKKSIGASSPVTSRYGTARPVSWAASCLGQRLKSIFRSWLIIAKV